MNISYASIMMSSTNCYAHLKSKGEPLSLHPNICRCPPHLLILSCFSHSFNCKPRIVYLFLVQLINDRTQRLIRSNFSARIVLGDHPARQHSHSESKYTDIPTLDVGRPRNVQPWCILGSGGNSEPAKQHFRCRGESGGDEFHTGPKCHYDLQSDDIH